MCRQPFVGGIAVVDLGQDGQSERVGDVGHPGEELVDLGLDHEAGRAGLLDHVADGVEPDDPNPRSANCRSQRVIRSRVVDDVTSRSICSDQSAVPNEVQIRSSRPVSSIVTLEKGASGLRRKIRATSAVDGSSVGPDLVDA